MLVEPHWLAALAHAQRRMGFKSGTALLTSNELRSPISWGLIRPVILLNNEAAEAHGEAEAIIAHELAHVARLDWVKLLLSRVTVALFWFNPLVWLLAREAHQLREEAADDAVLASDIEDTDYARLLVGDRPPRMPRAADRRAWRRPGAQLARSPRQARPRRRLGASAGRLALERRGGLLRCGRGGAARRAPVRADRAAQRCRGRPRRRPRVHALLSGCDACGAPHRRRRYGAATSRTRQSGGRSPLRRHDVDVDVDVDVDPVVDVDSGCSGRSQPAPRRCPRVRRARSSKWWR